MVLWHEKSSTDSEAYENLNGINNLEQDGENSMDSRAYDIHEKPQRNQRVTMDSSEIGLGLLCNALKQNKKISDTN
jgi:hypothetical protein